jgi:ABC transporter DrrB family efflux protein
MTTLTAQADRAVPSAVPSPRRPKLAWAVADSLAVAQRNIIGMTRRPQVLAFATIQPVLFVLLFRYVFGSSIRIPGVSYADYLMAGIFVQTIMFGAQSTAAGMAEDLSTGLIERFRTLAMARSAVLTGRVLADALRNMFVLVLMLGVGYLVGFRLHTNAAALAAAGGVLLLFGMAISWVTTLLGLALKSAEAAAAASLSFVVLLGFPSSAFVPTNNLPGPLRAYADNQPLTATVNAVRPLLLGGPVTAHAVAAVIWCLGMAAVFAPLAVLRYRRTA